MASQGYTKKSGVGIDELRNLSKYDRLYGLLPAPVHSLEILNNFDCKPSAAVVLIQAGSAWYEDLRHVQVLDETERVAFVIESQEVEFEAEVLRQKLGQPVQENLRRDLVPIEERSKLLRLKLLRAEEALHIRDCPFAVHQQRAREI